MSDLRVSAMAVSLGPWHVRLLEPDVHAARLAVGGAVNYFCCCPRLSVCGHTITVERLGKIRKGQHIETLVMTRLELSSKSVVAKLKAYFEWGKTDKRLVAINPVKKKSLKLRIQCRRYQQTHRKLWVFALFFNIVALQHSAQATEWSTLRHGARGGGHTGSDGGAGDRGHSNALVL